MSCGGWNRTNIKTFRASHPTVRRPRSKFFISSVLRESNPRTQVGNLAPNRSAKDTLSTFKKRKERDSNPQGNFARLFSKQIPSPIGLPFPNYFNAPSRNRTDTPYMASREATTTSWTRCFSTREKRRSFNRTRGIRTLTHLGKNQGCCHNTSVPNFWLRYETFASRADTSQYPVRESNPRLQLEKLPSFR